jgi:hypothetical protein
MVSRVRGTLTIDPRFNGPPDSGNGGYTCGLLARYVDAPVAEVTLRLPPPLGRELAIEHGEDGAVALHDGDAVVAEARPTELAPDAPPAVEWAEANEAMNDSPFIDAATHPFPSCFVCGPTRPDGDGLRIFSGPAAARDVFAATWTPDSELAGQNGVLPTELIWAALDCPTSVPVANEPGPDFRPIVLARLAVRVVAPVRAGESHTIVSWPIELDGRKRHAGAALLAVARALWIELKPRNE